MEPDSSETINVSIQPRFRSDHAKVEFINYVRILHLGTDVFLDMCVVDPGKLIAILGQKQLASEVEAEILTRYAMSVNGLALLKRQVDEIWKKIQTSKLLDPDFPKR